MVCRLLAFDYDGTLAANGHVPPALQRLLVELQRRDYRLFLATGRRYGTLNLGSLAELFSGFVWENGAVVESRAGRPLSLPFGQLDSRLIAALQAAAIPLDRGRAIISTHRRYQETLFQIVVERGAAVEIVPNREHLMVLPPGANKGAGMLKLLDAQGYSPHNLGCFGDAENDVALFQVAEWGMAVGDAVPTLRALADVVANEPGPAGVVELLQSYWLPGRLPPVTSRRGRSERFVPLGQAEGGDAVTLAGATLAGENLGVFGDSGSGKSWMTGLLAEGMHLAGYQILVIDPEGDFRGLTALPGMVALSGDEETLLAPEHVTALLDEDKNSLILDLCAYPLERRNLFVADLLRCLQALREHRGRPHWIVLEEAQGFLPPLESPVARMLQPMLVAGGWAFVSYRPDRLAAGVLHSLHRCVLARLSGEEALEAVGRVFEVPSLQLLRETPPGRVWLCGSSPLRLKPASRQVPHQRHFYKYLDEPLPKHKRFYFHNHQGWLGLEAASLFEFRETLFCLPSESLLYHQSRGDFAAWIRGVLDDDFLAGQLEDIGARELDAQRLRQAIGEHVTTRLSWLQARR
jgi:hydroxymethylpyrimidine pyrophosphatase-like HAD family hydrolase